jgi:hypothetical protein
VGILATAITSELLPRQTTSSIGLILERCFCYKSFTNAINFCLRNFSAQSWASLWVILIANHSWDLIISKNTTGFIERLNARAHLGILRGKNKNVTQSF